MFATNLNQEEADPKSEPRLKFTTGAFFISFSVVRRKAVQRGAGSSFPEPLFLSKEVIP
jgi:hypothetical protein